VHIKLLDPATGAVLWHHRPQIRYLLSIMANDGWALVDMPFKLPAAGVLEVSILNKAMEEKLFLLDELLIRKAETSLYREGAVYLNGREY